MDNVTDINKDKQVKDLTADQDRPDVTRILVEYSDGSTKEVEQGAVITMTPVDQSITVNAEFKDMNGKEAAHFFEAMLTMSCQVLGINDDSDPENE